jgi:uncharacterized protein (DUF302 family)
MVCSWLKYGSARGTRHRPIMVCFSPGAALALGTRSKGGTTVSVVIQSRHSYADTLDRLLKAIAASGNTVFATIDQAAAAQAAGLTLRPTLLIAFGNPKAGTPLMEAFPLAALDLPLKLLVWEQDGSVRVAYTPASEVATRYGVTGKDALIAAMDAALGALAATVA